MTIGLIFEARDEGGLCVRSSSGTDGIQLIIGRDHAAARTDNAPAVALPWPTPQAPPPGSQWGISSWMWVKQWQHGKSGQAGIALLVTGTVRDGCAELLRETCGLGRRIAERDQAFATMPIVRSSSPALTFEAERDTLAALVALLQQCPDLRDRLDDQPRMLRLVAELNAGCEPAPTPMSAITRDRIDILTAMAQSSVAHDRGRPLPGQRTIPCADAIARVLIALRSNPHRGGRLIDEATVGALVHKAYCDVAPWPFTALVS